MNSYEKLPRELYTNPSTRDVYAPPNINETLPGAVNYFEDQTTNTENLLSQLHKLESSIFHLKSGGEYVSCSLIHGSQVSKEALIIFAPFSDSEPKSLPEYVYENSKLEKSGLLQRRKADSNSWNQITKSAVVHQLLAATGNEMPVLTVFSPLSPRVFNKKERSEIKKGRFNAAGRLAIEALSLGQSHLHGAQSSTRIDTIHLAGASLGAHNALGAASFMIERGAGWVGSLTAQELIIGPTSVAELAQKYFNPISGPESQTNPPENWIKISEPAIRSIDKNGYSPATFARMLRGMASLTFHKGMTHTEEADLAMGKLYKNNVPLLVAVGENSSLTPLTAVHMPYNFQDMITVKGTKGEMAGHIINEHVALSALVIAMGIMKAKRVERRINPR